jgi:protein required for attachment to host cells
MFQARKPVIFDDEDIMNATWILSANASRARFFSQASLAEPLEEVNNMVNEASRLPVSEIGESDRRDPKAAGKSSHNVGGARPTSMYEPPQTPEKHEAELFARDIAAYLSQAYRDGHFEKITLVVSPQFLGILRGLLDRELESAVNLEITKDYTQFSPEQLREQLKAYNDKH